MGKWIFGILVLLAGLSVACGAGEPTQVLDPTAAPTATCPTADESEYFDDLGSITRSIGGIVGLISEDFARASQNPRLLEDDIWAMGITGNADVISRQADAILALTPPASAVDMGQVAEEMALRIKTAMSLYAEGVKNVDLDALEGGNTILTLAGDDARHITGLINTFC